MLRIGKCALVVAAVAALTSAALADPVQFALNGDNTTIKFVGTKPGGRHDGGFKKVTGTLTVDGDKTSINVEIDANSIYTDTEKLTTHLKSPDFFNVKANPTAKFVSTKVEKAGDKVTVTGDLTLNGKTKSISFPATLAATGASVTLNSKFTINRQDFGMTYGKGKVDDTVSLTVAVEAKK